MKYTFWILNISSEPPTTHWFQGTGNGSSPWVSDWNLYRRCLFPYASLLYDDYGSVFDVNVQQMLWYDKYLVRQ